MDIFVYKGNENGGGTVACSDEISLGPQLERLPLVLGLLTEWVCQSRGATSEEC